MNSLTITLLTPTIASRRPGGEFPGRRLARRATGAERTNAMSGHTDQFGRSEPIAVVGMACRLPGANCLPAFWQLLRDGQNMVRPTTSATTRSGVSYGAFLEGVDMFDAAFFSISPAEAAAMDPQQRLMLELSWEALEDADLIPAALAGSFSGVYIGTNSSDYEQLAAQAGGISRHAMTGEQRSMIANRISYQLGLRGPSMTIDSGQSSSAVAVHAACASLRTGESVLALAGGINLALSPQAGIRAERFGALSPDGQCYTFDARANG